MIWRPVRVTALSAKAGLIVLGGFAVLLVGVASWAVLGEAGSLVLTALAELLILAFLTRIFRGDKEDVFEQRRWWVLTASPLSGFVVGGLFASGFVGAVLMGPAGLRSAGAGTLMNLALGLLFMLSALAQMMFARR